MTDNVTNITSAEGLTARDLLLFRGDRCLLDGVSLTLRAGEGLVLRGPNGTGKTTLLRVLCGLTQAEEGEVMWNGAALHRVADEWHLALGWAGHLTGFKSDLTVRENLAFAAGLKGNAPAALPTELALDNCLDLPVRALSAGQKRRIGLAAIVTGKARVWLLDEPYTHLDQQGQSYLNDCIRHHLDAGGSALIASHGEAHSPLGLPEVTLSGGKLSS